MKKNSMLFKCFLLLIVAVVMNFIITEGTPDFGYIKAMVLIIGAPVLLLFGISSLSVNHKAKINTFGLIILIFLLLGVSSIIWSSNKSYTFVEITIWIALACLVINTIRVGNEDKSTVLKTLVITGGVVAILGIIQYLFNVDIVSQAAKPASVFGNANMAGHLMVLLLPIAFYLYFIEKSKFVYLWATIITSIISYVFYTKTASAWISIFIELVVLTIYLTTVRKEFLLSGLHKKGIVASVLLTLVMINISNDGFTPFWEQVSKEATGVVNRVGTEDRLAPRYQLWEATIDSIKEKPVIGSGLGTFYEQMKSHGYSNFYLYQRSHNDYLELTLELGLIGLFLLLIILLVVIKPLLVNIARKKYELSSFVTISLIGVLIVSIFSFPLQMAAPLAVAVVLISLSRESYQFGSIDLQIIITKPIKITVTVLLTIYCLFLIVTQSEWNAFIKKGHKVKTPESHWIKPMMTHPLMYTIISKNSTQMYAEGGFDEAIELSDKLLYVDENFYWSNFIKAVSLYQKKAYKNSLPYAIKAYEQSPKKEIRPAVFLMQFYLRKSDKENARVIFKDLIKIDREILQLIPEEYNKLSAIAEALGENSWEKELKNE